MRLPNNRPVPRLARGLFLLVGAGSLSACAVIAGDSQIADAGAATLAVNGPRADYPVVIGDPYVIDGTTFTPSDTLNYDEVGYAVAGAGEGITGAHHTLPVPSYVEVTSLETGRTILVRLERRGPMDSVDLVALSPAAMAQLEASAGTPVRVRRVNAPEDQRARLRAGGEVPPRMDTPMSLVQVLRRRLPEQGSVSLRASAPAAGETSPAANTGPVPAAVASASNPDPSIEPVMPPLDGPPTITPAASTDRGDFEAAFADSAPAEDEPPVSAPIELEDGFVVQAAAFSTEERALRVAENLGGTVSRSGRYFRVRTGPFATRSQAEASLANVRAAGYTDARIYSTG